MVITIESTKQMEELQKFLLTKGTYAKKILHDVMFNLKTKTRANVFVVDKWPDPKIVMQRGSDHQLDNSCSFYSTTTDANLLEEFFGQDVLDWSKCWEFAGCSPNIYSKLQEIVISNGGRLDPRPPIKMLILKHGNVLVRELPKGYNSGPLRVEDTDLINLQWEYGGTKIHWHYIHKCITNMSSLGIRDDDGHLIAYEMQNHYGAVCNLFVHPEHRGRGLAKCVITLLAKQLEESGEDIFCFVITKNKTSMNLHHSVGFEVLEDYDFTWADYYPKILK